MKDKKLRSFIVNGTVVTFNVPYFKRLFLEFAQKNNMGVVAYEYEVADALFVDRAAIHNWRMSKNGPGDLDKIKMLANLWHIKYENLLLEVKEMQDSAKENVKVLADRERAALKNVYVSFLNYMQVFVETKGFLFNEDGTDYNINQAYLLYNQVRTTLEYEYIDLAKTVYKKLNEFFDGDFSSTLEAYVDEGDSVEMLEGDAREMYEHLLGSFRDLVEEYL